MSVLAGYNPSLDFCPTSEVFSHAPIGARNSRNSGQWRGQTNRRTGPPNTILTVLNEAKEDGTIDVRWGDQHLSVFAEVFRERSNVLTNAVL